MGGSILMMQVMYISKLLQIQNIIFPPNSPVWCCLKNEDYKSHQPQPHQQNVEMQNTKTKII